jgi:anti-sigma factor RsiW
MTCNLVNKQLDDYVDAQLDVADMRLLDEHVAHCAECQEVLDRERALRASLKEYGDSSMPQPGVAFFDRALAKAVQSGTRRQRNRWVMTGFGGAMAAALAVWMIGGSFFATPEFSEPAIASIAMVIEEPRTVNLVFSSATPLNDATMTVTLPEGIEVMGFQGQREITWMTSLKKGKNILPLTLIATSALGGELLATLRHADDDRSFRVQVTVI